MSRIRHIASIAAKYIEYINKSLLVLSMMVIATLTVIIAVQVIMRYFFKEPTSWVFELSEYAMVLVVFLPLARVEQLKAHIKVDILARRVSQKKINKLNVVVLALSLFYIAIFSWSAIRQARLAYNEQWNSGPFKLGWDQWPIWALMGIGVLLLCLNIAVSLVRQIAEIINKEQDDA